MINLVKYLSENEYPGRGIAIGLSADSKAIYTAYFIMGRSENSRNRIFIKEEDGIRTQAFDETKMKDPSLIIYAPVRVIGDTTIVTNGDQTDTIYNFIKAGKSFEEALRTREFEPDEPNFTPRISAIIKVKDTNAEYSLSILKSADGCGSSCRRFFYEYLQPQAGVGQIIHTYERNGTPIPSFYGEPRSFSLDASSLEEFGQSVWNALNEENKVSLFVRKINLDGTGAETIIYNKNI